MIANPGERNQFRVILAFSKKGIGIYFPENSQKQIFVRFVSWIGNFALDLQKRMDFMTAGIDNIGANYAVKASSFDKAISDRSRAA